MYLHHQNIAPGYIARKHELAIDLEEMRRAHLELELTEHLTSLRSALRIKEWLNPILKPYGLQAVRRNFS